MNIYLKHIPVTRHTQKVTLKVVSQKSHERLVLEGGNRPTLVYLKKNQKPTWAEL